MTELRQIPDGVYGEAGEVIRAVSGKGPRPAVEAMVGFEAMVAGTVIALEKGAPHAMYESRATPAEEWLREGSDPWRKLHTATARAIDLHRTREVMFDGPEGVMVHIASDVLNQAQVQHKATALRFNDKPFDDRLTPEQLEDVRYARDHPRYADDINAEAHGLYSQLGKATQRSLADMMEKGENLPEGFREHLAPSVAVIARDLNDLPYRNREVDERLAEFSDKVETGEGRDLFKAARSEDLRRVDELRAGDAPIGNVEMGIVAHMMVHEQGVRQEVTNAAYARALVEQEGRSITPPQVAVRLEAEVIAVGNARTRAMNEIDDVNGVPDHVDQIAFERKFDRIEPAVQIGLFQELEYGENVPALKAMKLGHTALAIENGELRMERERGFTYENTDAEATRDYRLDGLYLPGDKVRMDEKVNVRGVDKDALRETLGTEPLEIARTVIVGTEHDNGMGGTSPAVRPEYEFVGHKDRYPAGQFQHERGDEHVYGMIAVVDERMFLVPLDDKAEQNAPVVTGPAREIVATMVSSDEIRNNENIEIMRHEVGQVPVAGEFVFRPDAYGRKEGPVELVAVPWMSDVGSAEHEAGIKAIHAEIAKGAPEAARDLPSALDPLAGARTAAFAASQAAHSRG
jgi:hypothetical protein